MRRHITTIIITLSLVIGPALGKVGDTPAAGVAAAGPANATFVTHDIVTQGNWKTTYGTNGAEVVNDSVSYPAYATVTKSGSASWTWEGSPLEGRALQRATMGRIAATDYASSSFTYDVNLTDSATHQIALHVIDWDNLGRSERIDVLDAVSGTTLDTRTAAGFASGDYFVWRVSGHVRFEITRLAGANAVVSGLFFDPPVGGGNHTPPLVSITLPPGGTHFTAPATVTLKASVTPFDGATVAQVAYFAGATQVAQGTVSLEYPAQWTSVPVGTYALTAHVTDSQGGATISDPVSVTVDPSGPGSGAVATFVQTDVMTKGNWPNAYGADGSAVPDDHTSYPFYAQVALAGQQQFTWGNPTSDVRALVKAANPNSRIASTYYASTSFSIDVNLTDGATHQIAFYLVDWDSLGRNQSIQAFDADSNAQLDVQIVPSFAGGQYLVWNIAGHVRFQVARLAGPNAVVSGIFFDTPLGAPVPAAAALVKTDTTTQGDWPGHYGADGLNVVSNQAAYPAYAHVSTTGVADWTWLGMTADGRALRKATNPSNASDRIAATLYSSTTFSIDVNLVDGLSHQVAFYLLDWDSLGRSQLIEALDAVSGAVLDTQTVPSFGGGQYWVYRAAGHVKFRFTRLAGANAVVSGIFFDAAPNAPPSFTKGPDKTVLEDAGAQIFPAWAPGISPGPAESGQTVHFNVAGNTNPGLFSAGPAISPTGTLSFTPAADATGTATLTITLQDDGGTANGGLDTSAPQSFLINVTAVNDAPSFTKGPDKAVFGDAGAQTFPAWATAISPGPAESGQMVHFNVTGNTNSGLFSAGPAISPTGTLSFTPAANADGTATITITLQDDGGTANGGVDTSAPRSFVVTVRPRPSLLISVDFGQTGSPLFTGPESAATAADLGFGAADIWNGVNFPAGTNPSFSNLLNSSGTATSVGLSFTGTPYGYDGFNNSSSDGLRKDYLYLNGGANSATSLDWAITGLTPGARYEFFAYGGNHANGSFNLAVDTTGGGNLVTQLVSRDSGTAFFSSVIADGSGTIHGRILSIGPIGGNNEADWAGFQLAAVPQASLSEQHRQE